MSVSPRSLTVVALLAVVAAAVVVANNQTKVPDAAPAASASVEFAARSPGTAAPARKLLFFMNPNGYPCQAQKSILDGISDTLSRLAQVVYIKTTEQADLRSFEQYGIRALPTLVVADGNGRELRRFAPGIQSGETVLAGLNR